MTALLLSPWAASGSDYVTRSGTGLVRSMPNRVYTQVKAKNPK
jgi:hypothetical protein